MFVLILIQLHLSDVSVEFAEASYTVSEADMSVELCVNLTGLLERQVSVQILTIVGGDATAVEDYLPLSEELIFVESESILCSVLEVLNDTFIENAEEAIVSLFPTDSAVIISSPTLSVTILDSNRELK